LSQYLSCEIPRKFFCCERVKDFDMSHMGLFIWEIREKMSRVEDSCMRENGQKQLHAHKVRERGNWELDFI